MNTTQMRILYDLYINSANESSYIKNLIGVITRTSYTPSTDEKISDKFKYLEEIYKKTSHYFNDSDLRLCGEECWPLEADSMIGVYRLHNVYHVLKDVIENNIEGDFVETGVWKGGSCVLANAIIHEYKQEQERRVHLFDSFSGLPMPYMKEDEGDIHHTHECLAISIETVKGVCSSYGLLTPNLVFRRGWFKDTMQNVSDIDKISVLRLDGDMYSSTIEVLDALYDKVPVGGYIIIDDWCLPGARQAVVDFTTKRKINPNLIAIDNASCYWKKEI